jgi:hypothetical protein
MAGVNPRAGDYARYVTLSKRDQTTGDDATFVPLASPNEWVAIEPAAPSTLGDARVIQHLVRLRYRSDVTIDCCVTYLGRQLFVRGIQNVNEDDSELRLYCEEIVG